jgi:hypothetical protein
MIEGEESTYSPSAQLFPFFSGNELTILAAESNADRALVRTQRA